MKIFQKYLIITILFFSLLSCEKYLDVKRTNSQVAITSARDLQLLLDNTSPFNLGMSNDANLSSDDFYVDDNIYVSSNASNEDRNLYSWNFAAIRQTGSWQHTYSIIYKANLVLEYAAKFSKNRNEDDQTLDVLKGMALFYRAWGHWHLAQLYAKPYIANSAAQDLGIPLKLFSDINEKIVRSSVKQTYDQIVQDLKDAIAFLPKTVLLPTRPSKAAGFAMLARVYHSMEDYDNALESATSCLQINNELIDFNTLSITQPIPFTRFNKEVIFHSIASYNYLLEPGSDINPISKIDPALINSYESNDLRKKLYIKLNTGLTHAGTYRFSGNYAGLNSSELFNGLAVDEVYLIRAECYARTGNNISALADLNSLLKTRWLTGTYTDFSIINSDDLLSKILLERKKELLMRGLRWSDLRRINRDSRFAKTISRTTQGIINTLPPNDNRYVLLIPTDVILNKNVTQNFR
jgi:tetratricopeptide (TPR) repeat protein